MKIQIVFLLFFHLLGSVQPWCQEKCASPSYPTCKNLVGSNAGFEKVLDTEECTVFDGSKGDKTLVCCYNEEFYNQYKVLNRARAVAGAEENEYPHQIRLISPHGDKVNYCGGTVYNKDWIITASHCIKVEGETFTFVGQAYVIAGKSDADSATDDDKFYVAEIITHYQWDDLHINKGHDIALLRLNRSLPLKAGKIQPLRVAQPGFEPRYGGKGILVGYGNVHATAGVGSRYLLEFQAPIHHFGKVGRLSFIGATKGGRFPLDHHLGVGGDDSGVTMGQGDSGGPFICADENNKAILCGVASFKGCDAYKMCKQANYFTRVDKFYDWIMNHTNNAEQEKDMLFSQPMFPVLLKDNDVPAYLYRIGGKHMSCSAVLVTPELLVAPAECIRANGGDNGLQGNVAIGHYKTEMPIRIKAARSHEGYKPNYSANISTIFKQPFGILDIAVVWVKDRQPKENVIELAPVNYQIKEPALEYTLNEKSHGVEVRRFLPMERKECTNKFKIFDEDLKLNQDQLCMRQVYSAEAECGRDVGGPLVCDGKLCGTKTFHACGASAFPEVFNDFTVKKEVRSWLEGYIAISQ